MARGLQKVQSQQKNADALKKAQGGNSNLKTQSLSLKLVCPACKLPTANKNNLVEHWDAKHSGQTSTPWSPPSPPLLLLPERSPRRSPSKALLHRLLRWSWRVEVRGSLESI
ncbi:hypothetical protein BDY24DRAFT_59298 [Mrakia frigida]|uniref:uncharacterized protein n=1 Tax=Mrakia frigida TaxID=29902 RepID=UPI003FCBFF68